VSCAKTAELNIEMQFETLSRV